MHTLLKSTLVLLASLSLFTACDSSSSKSTPTDITSIDLSDYSLSALSDTQKYSLAHMWFEEKLAHDLYLDLYDVTAASQLTNIATRSEVKHIQLVEDLVVVYDLNITNYLNDYMINYSKEELAALPRGTFAIPAIQTLYDDLFAQGKVSKQASLEVGCIVEVVDVDDLNLYIEGAQDNTALVDTFTILREGSYAHYWSFDDGLKKLGISNGCCSLGVEFCKTADEYPQK